MDVAQFWYLPLSPAFFLILVAFFFFAFILLPLRLLEYAYEQLGVSPRTAIFLLFVSLIGSTINIPIAVMSQASPMASQTVDFYGMRYVVPEASNWGGTVLAVNVGGAIIPVIMSLYLLAHWQLWREGLIGTAIVAAICYYLATPVPGIGIAIPTFAPVIATTIVALLLSRSHAAPLAYIAGSFGTLIGADLMNLGRIADLKAPIASIGGAGTFDGIFLTGIVAVLIASIRSHNQNTTPMATGRR